MRIWQVDLKLLANVESGEKVKCMFINVKRIIANISSLYLYLESFTLNQNVSSMCAEQCNPFR